MPPIGTLPERYRRAVVLARDVAVGDLAFMSPHDLIVEGDTVCFIHPDTYVEDIPTGFRTLAIERSEFGFAVTPLNSHEWLVPSRPADVTLADERPLIKVVQFNETPTEAVRLARKRAVKILKDRYLNTPQDVPF